MPRTKKVVKKRAVSPLSSHEQTSDRETRKRPEVFRPEGVITNRAFNRSSMTNAERSFYKKHYTHLVAQGSGLKPWRVRNSNAPKFEAAPRPDNSQKVKAYVPQGYSPPRDYWSW